MPRDDCRPGPAAQRRPVLSRAAVVALTRAAVWAAVFLGLLSYALLFRSTYVDDAYITLQYARNLADHLTWGFYPDRISNTATSPLNVVALAVADRLTPGGTVDAVAPLTAAIWTALAAVLIGISGRITGQPHAGLLAAVGLVTNPLLLSAIGLEGYLFALLMLVCLDRLLAGRPGQLGAALALLTLTRPDGALLALLMILVLPGGRRARVRLVAAGLATAAPWYLFSWLYLGSLVPDTLILKLEENAWGPTTFSDGLFLYRDRFPVAVVTSLWPVLLVPLALFVARRTDGIGRLAFGVLAAFAVLHYAAYSIMAVPPFHWYFTSEIVAVVVLGGFGAAALVDGLARSPDRVERLAGLAATALPAAGLLCLVWVGGTPWRSAPVVTNWGRPADYLAVGHDLRDLLAPGDVVDLHGEIGTVAYACGDCTLVDRFTDLNRTTAMADDLRARHPGLVSTLLGINFAFRDELPALPAPTYVLDFVPVDRHDPPFSGPAVRAEWDVSSSWVRATTITLRRATTVTLDVRMLPGPDGVVPAPLTPAVGGYTVTPVVAPGTAPQPITGQWSLGLPTAIPAEVGATVVVRIEHPAYQPVEVTVVVHEGENRIDVQYPALPQPAGTTP